MLVAGVVLALIPFGIVSAVLGILMIRRHARLRAEAAEELAAVPVYVPEPVTIDFEITEVVLVHPK